MSQNQLSCRVGPPDWEGDLVDSGSCLRVRAPDGRSDDCGRGAPNLRPRPRHPCRCASCRSRTPDRSGRAAGPPLRAYAGRCRPARSRAEPRHRCPTHSSARAGHAGRRRRRGVPALRVLRLRLEPVDCPQPLRVRRRRARRAVHRHRSRRLRPGDRPGGQVGRRPLRRHLGQHARGVDQYLLHLQPELRREHDAAVHAAAAARVPYRCPAHAARRLAHQPGHLGHRPRRDRRQTPSPTSASPTGTSSMRAPPRKCSGSRWRWPSSSWRTTGSGSRSARWP